MIILKLGQDLLHYGLTEKNGLGTYPELLAILSDGSHLAVIQIDDLPMATHKRCLLLLKIFRIDARYVFLLLCHCLPAWNKTGDFLFFGLKGKHFLNIICTFVTIMIIFGNIFVRI